MFKYKILVGISGSIAAYKSCELVSQLKKQGHEVRVMMTQSATEFVGPLSLQALSGHPVALDDSASPNAMTHINWGQWCDAFILYPATAQTINSLAAGVGSEILTSFFLAYDFKKPFLIAPAMNTRMLKNPITKDSLRKLAKMGCEILPTESGDLACGENGAGRLLPADLVTTVLKDCLHERKSKTKRILITAGGTRETIDGVRTLTNVSTGQTGALLADYFQEQGAQVLLLTSSAGVRPQSKVRVDTYDTFNDIYNTLKALSQTQQFDAILHAAAISDYSISRIKTPDGAVNPGQEKMSSKFDNISIELKRNEKILPHLKDLFGNQTTVVGFKLTSTESKEEQARAIFSLFTENSVDFVVHNDMNDINQGKRHYLLTSKEGQQKKLTSVGALGTELFQTFENANRGGQHDLMS